MDVLLWGEGKYVLILAGKLNKYAPAKNFSKFAKVKRASTAPIQYLLKALGDI